MTTPVLATFVLPRTQSPALPVRGTEHDEPAHMVHVVIAALDESTPDDPRGIYYVLGATVFLSDRDEVTKALRAVVDASDRIRPFHWHREGTLVRTRMLDCLAELGAVGHVGVHYPTGRRRQERARARCLATLAPLLAADGVDELVIESRGTDRVNRRDARAILGMPNSQGSASTFAYGWYDKTEPLLWSADALCGAVHEYLVQKDDRHYRRLEDAGIITGPIYLTGA